MAKQPKHCSTCGAKMVEYSHSLSESLVNGLYKISKYGVGVDVSIEDIDLTAHEWTNFQKLRYWDLVEKGVKEGLWHLTDRGRQFISGQITVNKRVVTYRGSRVAYKGNQVQFAAIFKTPDTDLSRPDYAAEAVDH